MSPPTNGENEFKQKLARVEKQLDEYQQSKGIFQLKNGSAAEKYMAMPQAEIRMLGPDECFEAAIELNKHGAYLQEAYNKEVSRVNWIEAELRRVVIPRVRQYNGASADERRYAAIMDDEYSEALDKLKMWAQALADRLSFMANRAEAVARSYTNLGHCKRKDDGRQG